LEILDAHGLVVPTADHEIAFAVESEGRLIGVDSGNPQSHDSYKADGCKAFGGMCLAVVRVTGKAGKINVAASTPGVATGKLLLFTKA
jgi:beta-galactosidase